MSGIFNYRERPHSHLYALAITLFMSAFYYDAPVVAVQGGVLLVGTTWYIHTGNDEKKDGEG